MDTRERYGFRFSQREVQIEKAALPAGDYAVSTDEHILASVERKTIDGLMTSLSDGTMAFQMQRLAEIPLWRRSGGG